MAEPTDIVIEHLRQIRAEVAAAKMDMQAGFARIEAKLAPMDEAVRGLARIAVGLVAAIDDVRDRLGRLERGRTP
jgi:hypothetical protein